MSEDVIAAVQEALGYHFANRELLEEALTHASYADARTDSNERLEFLGDAVLGIIVCEELFRRFPAMLEGDLTKIKSTVVSRKTCAKIVYRLGIADYLVLGKGMQNHDRLPGSVAAAMLEAIVGAIYLDAGAMDDGMRASHQFLMPLLEPVIDQAADSGHHQNFKSVLQQFAQERFDTPPAYILLDEQGPDHAKCFEVCVQLGADRFESCWGQSKKDAEQKAALNALTALGLIEEDASGQIRVAPLNGAESLDTD